MKHDTRIASQILALLLTSLTTLLLASPADATSRAQKDNRITKTNLLRSLKANEKKPEKKMSAAEYVADIKDRGVDFCMTIKDEQEVRQSVTYLGAEEMNDLIAAVRDNCRNGHNVCCNERLRVSLFEYATCDRAFADFEAMISSKISMIPSMFESDDQYNYIARLTLVNERKPFDMNREEADRYWKETRSLQLLRGMCKTGSDGVYVYSQVFLGELRGALDTPVRIDFKIDAQEYGTTKDIHSVLILYSLAQEARARGLNEVFIKVCLKHAWDLVTQIRNTDAATVQSIKSAIEGTMHEMGVDPYVIPEKLE